MHDIVFSKEILRVVNGKRQSLPGSSKIVGVRVLLSPLCHVTARTLTEAFTQMVKGTDLEHLSLDIKPLTVKMKCLACGNIFEVRQPAFACPGCGAGSITVYDNREFLVESMDVED